MKISYDKCAISYANCTIIKLKNTSRVGGIFRVGRVTPIQQKKNWPNSDLDGMSLASFCQSMPAFTNSYCTVELDISF